MSNKTDDFDYQRYAILFVDDEAITRKYFRRLFREKFRILEAEDGLETVTVLREYANEIGINRDRPAHAQRDGCGVSLENRR